MARWVGRVLKRAYQRKLRTMGQRTTCRPRGRRYGNKKEIEENESPTQTRSFEITTFSVRERPFTEVKQDSEGRLL